MSDYSRQLRRLRFWNRTATFALICALPATFLIAFIANGTALDRVLPFGTLVVFSVVLFVAYVRIRTFPCPRCGNYFTVKHPLGARTRDRKCVHCGLEAYAGF